MGRANRSLTQLARAAGKVLLGLPLLLTPRVLQPHEVPPRVTVIVYARPSQQTLRTVVRAPLVAMRDMELPLRGPGYMDIAGAQPHIEAAARTWIADYLRLFEEGVALPRPNLVAARVSLPTDRSFDSFEGAERHVTGSRLPEETDLLWTQALLDVVLDYPIASASARFSMEPMLAHLGIETRTVVHFLAPGEPERVFQFTGNPGLVRLDPRWHQATGQFVALGVEHILQGIDHLLFILCLVIPFRRLRALVAIVTAFTVAHSITLMAAAAGLAPDGLWFPPLVETLIAASIVFMALENILGSRLDRRWLIAFAFGLVHGFGFSFALRESMQLAGRHLVSSLVAFNVGVELGQVLVVVVAVPLLDRVLRRPGVARIGTIVLSALIAHTAWHWMVERGAALREFRLGWPAFDTAFAIGAMRAGMLVLVALGALWVVRGLVRWLGGAEDETSTPAEPVRSAGAMRA